MAAASQNPHLAEPARGRETEWHLRPGGGGSIVLRDRTAEIHGDTVPAAMLSGPARHEAGGESSIAGSVAIYGDRERLE